MTRRADEPHRDEDATVQFTSVSGDDAFVDAIAAGEDPSHGTDPLAAALLGLKREVDAPMPAAPHVPATPAQLTAAAQPAVAAPSAEAVSGEAVSLDAARARRRERDSMNPWLSGFIGAAAATAVIAGSGAALYSATPSSPLWGVSSGVFGDHAAAVELASTLDEIEVASQEGNYDSVAALLHQARALVDSMHVKPQHDGSGAPASEATHRPGTVTVTVTSTPGGPAPAQPSEAASSPNKPQPSQEATQPGQPQPSGQSQQQESAQPGSGQSSQPKTEKPSKASPTPPRSSAKNEAPSVQPSVVEAPQPVVEQPAASPVVEQPAVVNSGVQTQYSAPVEVEPRVVPLGTQGSSAQDS